MCKRRWLWLLLVALTGVALAAYFEPTHCVRGWLWGSTRQLKPWSLRRPVPYNEKRHRPELRRSAMLNPRATPWVRRRP
jgi:hypothetical protein